MAWLLNKLIICNNIVRYEESMKKTQKNSGQAVLEYILLLAMVVGMLSIFISKFVGSFDAATQKIGGKMEKQLRTGKAPPSIWNK